MFEVTRGINIKDTIKDKLESINVEDLNNAKIEIECWDKKNPITWKIEHEKKGNN